MGWLLVEQFSWNKTEEWSTCPSADNLTFLDHIESSQLVEDMDCLEMKRISHCCVSQYSPWTPSDRKWKCLEATSCWQNPNQWPSSQVWNEEWGKNKLINFILAQTYHSSGAPHLYKSCPHPHVWWDIIWKKMYQQQDESSTKYLFSNKTISSSSVNFQCRISPWSIVIVD